MEPRIPIMFSPSVLDGLGRALQTAPYNIAAPILKEIEESVAQHNAIVNAAKKEADQ